MAVTEFRVSNIGQTSIQLLGMEEGSGPALSHTHNVSDIDIHPVSGKFRLPINMGQKRLLPASYVLKIFNQTIAQTKQP